VSDHPFRDKAAIVGLGATPYSRNSGVSTLTLALRAVTMALDDAGLTHRDVDGVACHRVGDSVQSVVVAQSLGIRDLRYHQDLFGGGSSSNSMITSASMAVVTGMADVVVVWRSLNARSEMRMGGTGRSSPDTVEFQYQMPYGFMTPPQQFAMYARAWMHATSTPAEALGHVAINQRNNASRNERALMRTPFSMEEYLESRWIVEPFRLLDCCLETDAAVAMVITSAERARDLRRTPVLVSGATFGSGHTLYSNQRGDLGTTAAKLMAPRLFSMAGVGPGDIDVAELYDAFTPLVLQQLEDYGFVGWGEAKDFVAEGRHALGGDLPVNTHGGHLSEGYVHGLNHVAEAVRQLRHDAGELQVPGAEVALSTGQPGYVAGSTSAVILRRGA
jgi:acetyl-CoA acetyltransferase